MTVASEINQVPASRFVRTLKDVREAKDSKAAHAQERKKMRNEPKDVIDVKLAEEIK